MYFQVLVCVLILLTVFRLSVDAQENLRSANSGPELRAGPVTDAERRFWSFQPIDGQAPPNIQDESWGNNTIDQFVRAGHQQGGLTPSRPASRRELLRRTTFNLTGLPPTPREMKAFLANDASDAFGREVDRLLESPAYGERAARLWLDVVRYADTAGETGDYPIPEAYLYRNYVIDAFNSDKPYDDFVREQLAGDLLARDLVAGRDAFSDETLERYQELVTATGFIAISRRFGFDPQNYHHLTIQDTIDTLGQSVLGLAIGCARCHDHKFDPVDREDYYAWYGIFESTKYAFPGGEQTKRPADFIPAVPSSIATAKRTAWQTQRDEKEQSRKALVARREQVNQALSNAGGNVAFYLQVRQHLLSDYQRDIDGYSGFHVFRPPEASLPIVGANTNDTQIKIPGTVRSRGIVVHPDQEFGVAITWCSPVTGRVSVDGRVADAHDAGDSVQWYLDLFRSDSMVNVAQGDVATGTSQTIDGADSRLESIDVHKGDFLQLSIFPKSDIGADLTAVEIRIEDVTKPLSNRCWDVSEDVFLALYNGQNPQEDVHGNSSVWYLHRIPATRGADWSKIVDPSEDDANSGAISIETASRLLAENKELAGQIDRLAAEVKELDQTQPYPVVFGVEEGPGKNARVHIRGEHKRLGEEIARRHLALFGGTRIASDERGSGRRQLAQWLTNPDNPLTARVMVNRIWQQHFGRGIVETANDFGVRGTRPSHPKLLDWLATRFVESDWSVKAMHRLIMNSQTYRMSSDFQAEFAESDPDNNLLWRFGRRRLSAEEIRDAMLTVGGNLDRSSMDEPHPFPPVAEWGFSQHAPFYGLYPSNRRSIYLMTQRLKRHPYLALFDGADPNVSTATRVLTTVPTQALFMMNSPFVVQQAEGLAQKLILRHESQAARIQWAFELALSRPANAEEVSDCLEFLRNYRATLGDEQKNNNQTELAVWTGLSRTLLTRNEFLFLD